MLRTTSVTLTMTKTMMTSKKYIKRIKVDGRLTHCSGILSLPCVGEAIKGENDIVYYRLRYVRDPEDGDLAVFAFDGWWLCQDEQEQWWIERPQTDVVVQ